MPYVSRDENGAIAAVFRVPTDNATEYVPPGNPEVTDFLYDRQSDPHQPLTESDAGMSRVVEDLIDLLIDKNIISFSDFPLPAQERMLERRRFRGALDGLIGLVNEEPDL